MPERVNPDNVVWVVGDHERRLAHMEQRTEDMSLFKSEIERCSRNIHDLRGSFDGLSLKLNVFASKEDVDSLRKALYTFALSITASAVVFAVSMLAVYR